MKRRTLLILALSMLLVIPALVAAAANGSDTGTPVATANQDRARTMRPDVAAAGTPIQSAEAAPDPRSGNR